MTPRRTNRRKGNKPVPAASEGLKRKWQDPEWRAYKLAHLRELSAKRSQPGQNRFGIPHGMRRPEAEAAWAVAKESARKTMEKLEASGALDETDAYAKEALQSTLEVLRSPLNQATRLSAAKLILDFCRAKPASKSEVTINKAEEWLAAIANDVEEEAPADAEEVA